MSFGTHREDRMRNKATVLSFPLHSWALALVPQAGFAQVTEFAAACTNVADSFSNFETILKVVSVMIVTIAIVFAGYQIAFAHKRLSDVAPILIGGLLIGGAATIAGWFVGGLDRWHCSDLYLKHGRRISGVRLVMRSAGRVR